MKRQLLTFAAALALLALLGHVFEKQLLAQVRAALVQIVDEPGRNPITLQVSSPSGPVFVTVPAGQRYVIQAFTGTCAVLPGDALTAVELHGSAGQDGWAPAFSYFGARWFASATTNLYFDPGSNIGFFSYSVNGTANTCNFAASGHSITLP